MPTALKVSIGFITPRPHVLLLYFSGVRPLCAVERPFSARELNCVEGTNVYRHHPLTQNKKAWISIFHPGSHLATSQH